ncbi:MAG: Lrp/AsnC family transcriptional regulator [Candidatus Bathyarchaeota archaeon]|nr:Lrp/AsnC family transcriptional regulator [Candidatus Bathyarchaeota archaeon]MDH5495557.1 Lrp/AsnC family transcriptional regulator [Candidatus Bathyarchaeota archaeon]
MGKLKDIDYKILSELMKNSKTSDRQVAKKIGVSQPTVTRRRARLEKDVIDGYSAIPKWEKLGYKILAFTFVKTRMLLGPEEQHKADHKMALKWMNEHPNVIYAAGCRGLGWNGFMISVHKSYSDFDNFIVRHNGEIGPTLDNIGNILVNLDGSQTLKPLHLKYLAEALSE